MNRVFTAPEYDNISTDKDLKIFLAGTIDMGSSPNWQEEIISVMNEALLGGMDKVIYNPRRSSFEGIDLEEQIKWELHHLDKSRVIIMNILPGSKSPISLMELGLYANSGKLLVCCPKEFYRYENVRIVCEKYKIPLFNNIGEISLKDLSSRL
jgi:hypothetical protein